MREYSNVGTPDTPWHLEYVKRDEFGPKRHPAHCVYYEEGRCRTTKSYYYGRKCGGTSHCEFYSDDYRKALEIAETKKRYEELRRDIEAEKQGLGESELLHKIRQNEKASRDERQKYEAERAHRKKMEVLKKQLKSAKKKKLTKAQERIEEEIRIENERWNGKKDVGATRDLEKKPAKTVKPKLVQEEKDPWMKKKRKAVNSGDPIREKRTRMLKRCIVCGSETFENGYHSLKKCRTCGMYYVNEDEYIDPKIRSITKGAPLCKMNIKK